MSTGPKAWKLEPLTFYIRQEEENTINHHYLQFNIT